MRPLPLLTILTLVGGCANPVVPPTSEELQAARQVELRGQLIGTWETFRFYRTVVGRTPQRGRFHQTLILASLPDRRPYRLEIRDETGWEMRRLGSADPLLHSEEGTWEVALRDRPENDDRVVFLVERSMDALDIGIRQLRPFVLSNGNLLLFGLWWWRGDA